MQPSASEQAEPPSKAILEPIPRLQATVLCSHSLNCLPCPELCSLFCPPPSIQGCFHVLTQTITPLPRTSQLPKSCPQTSSPVSMHWPLPPLPFHDLTITNCFQFLTPVLFSPTLCLCTRCSFYLEHHLPSLLCCLHISQVSV